MKKTPAHRRLTGAGVGGGSATKAVAHKTVQQAENQTFLE
jgi:hypothetical protein